MQGVLLFAQSPETVGACGQRQVHVHDGDVRNGANSSAGHTQQLGMLDHIHVVHLAGADPYRTVGR